MNTRKLLVILTPTLALVATVLALGASASSSAPVANKPDDGLPKQWIGVTRWTAGLAGQNVPVTPMTITQVTLTLKKKSSKGPYSKVDGSAGKTGTFYEYVPTGKITVTGWCKTPITVALKPADGGLSILVPSGKGVPAVYLGYDTSVLADRTPARCPDGTSAGLGAQILRWGFQTEFNVVKPGKRYKRRISTAAKMFAGKYVANDTLATYQPLDKYEWCFVRDRQDLNKCR
ncbi:MAG: hypothetical protein H0V84_04565 [Actinobacteria bacterium]|nr:hypothetical protein [Actinomycetota bacterium]